MSKTATYGRRSPVVSVSRNFPRRHDPQWALAAPTDAEMNMLGDSGVRRDGQGRPEVDASPDMAPIYARGLGDDHGIYHEMSRGNSAIAGVLALLRRVLARAYYRVEIPQPEGGYVEPTEKERARLALVRRFLGFDGSAGWLRGGLVRHLEQACDSFTYGFVPFEVVAEQHQFDGRTVWVPSVVQRLAPSSIVGWLWSRQGAGDTLVGLRQMVRKARNSAALDWFTPHQKVTIPADRIVLYTHKYEDGNPEGTSLLRSCWLAWEAWKGTFIRFQEAEERQFGGITIFGPQTTQDGEVYQCASNEDVEQFAEAAKLAAEGEIGWLKRAAGWEFEKVHPEYKIPSRVDVLEYCDRQIYSALAAVVMGLDISSSASAKLSGDLTRVFRETLDANARELCDVFNGLPGVPSTGILRRVIDWNFPQDEETRHPQLVPVGIKAEDFTALMDAVTKGAQFRIFSPTPKDEAYLRSLGGLPILTPTELAEARANATPGQVSQEGTQQPQEGTQAR